MNKIGIITFHNAINYGAILQCYALQSVLTKKGYNVKVINYTPEFIKRVFPNPSKITKIPTLKKKVYYLVKWILRPKQTLQETRKYDKLNEFIKLNLNLTKEISLDQLSNVSKNFDVCISGSDQIWDLNMTENDESYFLNFADEHTKKISYAASMKLSNLNDSQKNNVINLTRKYSYVSVREKDVQEFLINNNISSYCDVDPTMLLSKHDWEKCILSCKEVTNKKYVLLYYVNEPEKLIQKAFEYANKNDLCVISLNRIDKFGKYILKSDASIEEFLWLIKNADCVFTTSFHGMAFSTIFNINFFYEIPENSSNNNQRLSYLANNLSLQGQNINSLINKNIDWDYVNDKLEILRRESLNRLLNEIKE